MPNIISSFFNGFGNLAWWLVKKWKISFTLISIVILFFTSIVSSFDLKSPLPLINDVGGKVVTADNTIYQKTQEMVDSNNRFTFFKTLLAVGAEMWIVLLVAIVIYSLVSLVDKSKIFQGLAYTVLILFILQLCFNFYILSNDVNQHTFTEKAKLVVPFKGIFAFLGSLPEILNANPQSLNLAGE